MLRLLEIVKLSEIKEAKKNRNMNVIKPSNV